MGSSFDRQIVLFETSSEAVINLFETIGHAPFSLPNSVGTKFTGTKIKIMTGLKSIGDYLRVSCISRM